MSPDKTVRWMDKEVVAEKINSVEKALASLRADHESLKVQAFKDIGTITGSVSVESCACLAWRS